MFQNFQQLREEKYRKTAAGILLIAEDTGKILLLKRPKGSKFGNAWGLLSGTKESGETSKETILREVEEEVQFSRSQIKNLTKVGEDIRNKTHIDLFVANTPSELKPKLDEENDDAQWFKLKNIPSNTTPDLKQNIEKMMTIAIRGGKVNAISDGNPKT